MSINFVFSEKFGSTVNMGDGIISFFASAAKASKKEFKCPNCNSSEVYWVLPPIIPVMAINQDIGSDNIDSLMPTPDFNPEVHNLIKSMYGEKGNCYCSQCKKLFTLGFGDVVNNSQCTDNNVQQSDIDNPFDMSKWGVFDIDKDGKD